MSGTRRIGAACNAACNAHDTRFSGFHALFSLATKNSGKPGFAVWMENPARQRGFFLFT